ncbi:MAG: VOC family protein [Halioglobus sp.]|nr:VOC family protein [Halioglobus sp.]
MKRLHVNLAVANLDASVRFYSSLFDSRPTVLKGDYAKWMLDDPHVQFRDLAHGSRKGIDHLGIQVENEDELGEVHTRLKNAGAPMLEQGATTCCSPHSKRTGYSTRKARREETFLTRARVPFTAAMST